MAHHAQNTLANLLGEKRGPQYASGERQHIQKAKRCPLSAQIGAESESTFASAAKNCVKKADKVLKGVPAAAWSLSRAVRRTTGTYRSSIIIIYVRR